MTSILTLSRKSLFGLTLVAMFIGAGQVHAAIPAERRDIAKTDVRALAGLSNSVPQALAIFRKNGTSSDAPYRKTAYGYILTSQVACIIEQASRYESRGGVLHQFPLDVALLLCTEV